MTLIEQINHGIKESMKSKDTLRLETLRMLKSKILNADARGTLPDADVVKLFKTYLGNLQEGLEQARVYNRPEMATKLESEIVIVQEFLPQALSREETLKIVEQAVKDSGAKTKKELGLVMREIKKLGSNIDGKLAKDLADELLEG